MAYLENLNKADLQAEYKRVFGQEPDESLTKAALIEEIENAETSDDETEAANDANATAKKAIAANAKPPADGNMTVSRKNPDTGETETTQMPKAAYNNLPDHKYGWKPKAPKEVDD